MEDICIEQLIDESMQKIHPIGTTQKNPDFSAITFFGSSLNLFMTDGNEGESILAPNANIPNKYTDLKEIDMSNNEQNIVSDIINDIIDGIVLDSPSYFPIDTNRKEISEFTITKCMGFCDLQCCKGIYKVDDGNFCSLVTNADNEPEVITNILDYCKNEESSTILVTHANSNEQINVNYGANFCPEMMLKTKPISTWSKIKRCFSISKK